MSAPVPTSEPAEIRAGDTASWLITLADYPASAGWALTYTFINAGGKFTVASAAEGDAHRINKSPTDTAAWLPGAYEWQCRVGKSGEAYTVRTGSLVVKPDFATLATSDQRTHAKKMLDAITAWLENRDPGVAKYRISVGGADREMQYTPIADLLKLQAHYAAEVNRQAGSAGRSGRIYLRF